MAAEGGVIITYIFTGERNEYGDYIIPRNVTHLIIHQSVTVIPAGAFQEHPNIVEVFCHAGVKRIQKQAFDRCPRLKRVIIPGVEVVEHAAFYYCEAVTYVECPKLERVEGDAFCGCHSLGSINLPSAKVVEGFAFAECLAFTDAKFGKHLESIEHHAFFACPSLEQITIPLKNDLLAANDTFKGCRNLKRVDLVEGVVLHDTIAALLLDEWRNDMNEEIVSINQTLPDASAGREWTNDDVGRKAIVIGDWIAHILGKIIHYKAEHHLLLNVAASTLQLTLPNDIVMNNVMPFLELPEHTFEGEDQEEDDSNIDDSNDETNSDPGDDDYEEEGDNLEGEEDEDNNDDDVFQEQNEGEDVEARSKKRKTR